MGSFEHHTDETILADLGARLSALRLSRDLTQAELAYDAGVSKRTIERIEAGQSTQLTSFIRILRSLDLLGSLQQLLPSPEPGPMDLLRGAGKAPRRSRGSSAPPEEPWTWGDES